MLFGELGHCVGLVLEMANHPDIVHPVARRSDLGVIGPHNPPTWGGLLPYGIGANLGVRQDVFECVGGFDEDWPVLGGDEVDFCFRAQLAGQKSTTP